MIFFICVYHDHHENLRSLLLNNKLPIHTHIVFCCNPVKINAGREIISLEFDFIAGEMFGRLGGGSENIFYFYCAFLNFICVDGERCGFVEGVGGKHEAKVVQSLKFKVQSRSENPEANRRSSLGKIKYSQENTDSSEGKNDYSEGNIDYSIAKNRSSEANGHYSKENSRYSDWNNDYSVKKQVN